MIRAVAAVLRDDTGRVLLVKRGNEPDRGAWSLPGGRIEADELPIDAVIREMREETGLTVDVDGLLGQVERPHPDGGRYVIDDFAVSNPRGALLAADDATDAQWFAADALRSLRVTPELLEHLSRWGYLPEVSADA